MSEKSGGLARRAAYIKKVVSESGKCIIVESGDLASPYVSGQLLAKLETAARALRYMDYSAVGVGPMDLISGEGYYQSLASGGIPVVQLDLADHDGAKPYIVDEVDGVKVGIISFGAVPAEERLDLQLLKRRYAAYREARRASDVLVLLDQANVVSEVWLDRIGGRFGCPNIVIGGTSRLFMTEPKQIGQTMIVPTSILGRQVGRVDMDLEDSEKKMKWSRKELDQSVDEDAEVRNMLKAAEAPPKS